VVARLPQTKESSIGGCHRCKAGAVAGFRTVYEGHDGIRLFYSEVCDVWASYVWEPEELMEVGSCVVALLRSGGRGRASGVEVERRTAMVWTVQARRATTVRFFRDRDQALEAMGLAD
jgi:ketosteroid isomerase-like protein